MREIYRNFTWAYDGSIQDMLVEDGKVVYRGVPNAELQAENVVDCTGKSLAPAFIDNHCHILPAGNDLLKLQLGPCSTREEVLDAIRARHAEIPDADWLLAVHYDQTKFPDGRHLTRIELDSISSTRPILLRHVSGHASVANSATLQAANVNRDTPDPSGGTFGRDSSGDLDGTMFESAHDRVSAASPSLNVDQKVEAILRAAESMRGYGIFAACDMHTGPYNLDEELQAYRIASERIDFRFRLYLQWSAVFGSRRIAPERFKELEQAMDPDKCRIAGIKIFADGAIGAATAAIYGKFTSNPDGGDDQGQLIYSPERLKEMVLTAHNAGYQVSIHSIGDRATDLVMDAFEATGEPSRHRIEHAMMLSDAQIKRLARLNPHVCMQPEFLYRFGHAYRKQLGDERASKLKRFRSVKNAGLRLSFSSDRPIVSGDPRIGVRSGHTRPDGFDPAENLTEAESLQAYGQSAAEAMGDGERFGSLMPGQAAEWRAL